MSAILPAMNAPTAQPSSTDATAKPVVAARVPNALRQGVDRPVDDAAVEAEEKAADGGDRA